MEITEGRDQKAAFRDVDDLSVCVIDLCQCIEYTILE